MKRKTKIFVTLSWLTAQITMTHANTADPSYDDLIGILESARPQKIGQLLTQVAERFPSYLKKHTLVYRSDSNQGASHENPRAVVFGNDKRLVLTFNGDKQQNGYGNIELYSFDPRKGYTFRDIEFVTDRGAKDLPRPARGFTAVIDAADIERKIGNVVISKPNIDSCTQCHGKTHTRPIWKRYPVFPGVYGGAGPIKLVGIDTERQGFELYLNARASHSRYSSLGEPDKTDHGDAAYTPNIEYSQALYRQMSQLILKDIGHLPRAELARRLIACYDERPESVFARKFPRLLASKSALRAEMWLALESTFQLDLRQMSDFDFPRATLDFKAMDNPRFQSSVTSALLLKRLGLDPVDYNIGMGKRLAFDDGAKGLDLVREVLLTGYRPSEDCATLPAEVSFKAKH